MVEINITLELIKQVFKFFIGWGIGFAMGMVTMVGVIIIMWFIPNFKEKIRDLKLIRNFRKSIPMIEINCNQADCKHKDDSGRCAKEDINGVTINSQGECGSWEEKKTD